MTWWAIVEDATGELYSVGSVIAARMPLGKIALELPAEPLSGQRWNPVTRAFFTPVPPVPRDRLQEFLDDPEMAIVMARLRPAEVTALRNSATRALGERYIPREV